MRRKVVPPSSIFLVLGSFFLELHVNSPWDIVVYFFKWDLFYSRLQGTTIEAFITEDTSRK